MLTGRGLYRIVSLAHLLDRNALARICELAPWFPPLMHRLTILGGQIEAMEGLATFCRPGESPDKACVRYLERLIHLDFLTNVPTHFISQLIRRRT